MAPACDAYRALTLLETNGPWLLVANQPDRCGVKGWSPDLLRDDPL